MIGINSGTTLEELKQMISKNMRGIFPQSKKPLLLRANELSGNVIKIYDGIPLTFKRYHKKEEDYCYITGENLSKFWQTYRLVEIGAL